MTTIQVRSGDQSVIVQGEDLLVSLQGLFRLDAIDDHIVLEIPAAAANASSADLGDLQEQLQQYKNAVEILKHQASRGHFMTGRNIWNGMVDSDKPNARGPYRVCLYDVNGEIRGTCQCADFHFQGLGQGDLTYRCKHIVTALNRSRGLKAG